MTKIKGYKVWMFNPNDGQYSAVTPCEETLPELQNLLEHFDVEKVKITLKSGVTFNIAKWGV